MRLAQDFLCDIVADGLPLEGRTLNLNEQGLAVALPEPVFGDLDCVQVILTAHDGSLFHLIGRVVCQHQATVGEVVVGVQLAELSVEATTKSHREMCSALPLHDGIEPLPIPRAQRIARGIHALIGQPPVPPPDRRRIPRLPIHTACAILRPEMIRKGLTQDLSYSGLAVLFPNFSSGQLRGAILQVKFVKLTYGPSALSIEDRMRWLGFVWILLRREKNDGEIYTTPTGGIYPDMPASRERGGGCLHRISD